MNNYRITGNFRCGFSNLFAWTVIEELLRFQFLLKFTLPLVLALTGICC